MPNKNDTRAYQWPKNKDQMGFSNRVDQFPNGTKLTAYPAKVLEKEIQLSLERIVSSQMKSNK